MSLTGASRPALGVADFPLNGVAGGDRFQFLAGLKCNIGDVHRSDVELVKRPIAAGVDLNRIDVAGAGRFDTGGGIGEPGAAGGIARFQTPADRVACGSRLSGLGNESSSGTCTMRTGFGVSAWFPSGSL